ncbi:hypothetical protein CBL_07425 [Carabus blaptoides fortunei]
MCTPNGIYGGVGHKRLVDRFANKLKKCQALLGTDVSSCVDMDVPIACSSRKRVYACWYNVFSTRKVPLHSRADQCGAVGSGKCHSDITADVKGAPVSCQIDRHVHKWRPSGSERVCMVIRVQEQMRHVETRNTLRENVPKSTDFL